MPSWKKLNHLLKQDTFKVTIKIKKKILFAEIEKNKEITRLVNLEELKIQNANFLTPETGNNSAYEGT